MQQHVNTRTRRFIAFLMAVVLLFQCGVFSPFPVKAATSAQASGQLMLGIHPVDYHQHLRDNGDGTYTLTLTLTDGATVSAGNLNNKVSYNNYFTAPDDGDYLIQLWGGNGGNGGSTYVEGKDGVGGAGGYVYGVVTLKEGQTLYYQLGGNGYTSSSVASGGGANGPGGNAGENQEWFSGGDKPAIGGGGGYSAVYLFDKGEFEQYYLDANGNFLGIALSEDHRTSKHIMIAGGGGGGGYRADSDSSTPDGGVGGNMDTSASGATSDGGTFFSGTNGFTSGNSPPMLAKVALISPVPSRAPLPPYIRACSPTTGFVPTERIPLAVPAVPVTSVVAAVVQAMPAAPAACRPVRSLVHPMSAAAVAALPMCPAWFASAAI